MAGSGRANAAPDASDQQPLLGDLSELDKQVAKWKADHAEPKKQQQDAAAGAGRAARRHARAAAARSAVGAAAGGAPARAGAKTSAAIVTRSMGMAVWVALAAVGGALLGPSLHSWQLQHPLHVPPQQQPPQPPPAALRSGGAAAVLQRTVALFPSAFPDGLAFDPTPAGPIVVSALSPALAAATGLAVGDVVLSLAGVEVAGDHDPLSALDEAEEALELQLREQPPALLVVAPADAPLPVAVGLPPLPPPPPPPLEAQQQDEPVGAAPRGSGWRWSRDPCDAKRTY